MLERDGNRPELVVLRRLSISSLTQNSRKGVLRESWIRRKPLKRLVAVLVETASQSTSSVYFHARRNRTEYINADICQCLTESNEYGVAPRENEIDELKGKLPYI